MAGAESLASGDAIPVLDDPELERIIKQSRREH